MPTPLLSKSLGRIQWYGKVRYYSPNSEVDAPLQLNSEFEPKTLESNPFKPGKQGIQRVRYRDFVHPRIWTRNFAWLSFIPVIPAQWYCDRHSYFGQVLSQHPPINRFTDGNGRPSGFQVTPGNGWVQLESDLYDAVVALSGHYHIPCALPFLPSVIGYQEMYKQKRSLRRVLDQSREWFLVWFGALSYLVATLRNPGPWVVGLRAQQDHQWCSVLRGRGISPSFVDELQHSLVVACDGVRRAGIVLKGHVYEANGQPSPGWFKENGVAVWYQWGDEEEELARKSYWIQVLGPSPDLMNQMTPSPGETALMDGSLMASPDGRDGVASAAGLQVRDRLTCAQSSPTSPPQLLSSPSLSTYPPSPVIDSSVFSDHIPNHIRPSPALASSSTSPVESSSTTSTPAAQPSAAGDANVSPADNHIDGGRTGSDAPREPEWVAFFREREGRHELILRSETLKDRQRRENRMREPATSGAKVFEWYRSETSGAMYERLPVLAKARIDVLQAYGEAQKRYDPFFNEWDCCDEWGPEDDEDDDVSFEGPDVIPIPTAVASSLLPVEKLPLSLPISYTEADRPTSAFFHDEATDADSLLMDVEEVFGHFYGFSYPVPGSQLPSLSGYTDKDRTFFLRVLGSDPSSKPPLEERHQPHFHAAYKFLLALCDRHDPSAGSWDLRDECVHPVRFSPRFKCIRAVRLDAQCKVDEYDKTELYYVFSETNREATWKFAVTSASDALLACRLPVDLSAYELAVFFVQHGVPFRTFYPSRMLHRPPPGASTVMHQIPQRPFGHKFTKADYDAYVQMRTLLLGQSHMQAALKRGGIIWRLAVGTLGTSRATHAPSLWASSHRIELAGEQVVDDVLTTTELDLICGAYECVSDDGKQRSLKSWWPLVRYYEKPECGENYGRWTPRRECWYAKRLQAIESGGHGSQQPLTYTEWKSTQHGPSTIRILHAHIERSSSDLLASHAPPTP